MAAETSCLTAQAEEEKWGSNLEVVLKEQAKPENKEKEVETDQKVVMDELSLHKPLLAPTEVKASHALLLHHPQHKQCHAQGLFHC